MVDFNNDNIEDLVIGAPGEAPEGGRKSGFVFVFSRYFRSNGFYTEELIPSQGLDQRTLDANENGDLFGEALGAGDFNGDGFDDLAVGAPGEAPGPDSKSGAAFVFNGTSSGLTPVQELDQGELDANENGDLFGKALGAGDFNGDGFDDLAVGAPGEAPGLDSKSGAAFIFNGTSSGLTPVQELDQGELDANENGDLFGKALGAGDFNGDGFDDLAVGAPGEAPGLDSKSGAAFVFDGTSSGLTPVQKLEKTQIGGTIEDGDLFGEALGTGDFNGDGFDDLAVGAPGKGFVSIFNGSNTGLVPGQELDETQIGGTIEDGDLFGKALGIGDFNGDGFDDLAIGAPGEAPGRDPRSGVAFIFNGSSSGLTGDEIITQIGLQENENGDLFGVALATGDYDNNGFDDLIIGSTGEAPAYDPQSGAAFLFDGTNNGLLPSQAIDQFGIGSNEQGDLFGSALS